MKNASRNFPLPLTASEWSWDLSGTIVSSPVLYRQPPNHGVPVSTLIEFLTVHPHAAYLAVFFLALSESVPIIGVFVSGTAIIIALSAFVALRVGIRRDIGC